MVNGDRGRRTLGVGCETTKPVFGDAYLSWNAILSGFGFRNKNGPKPRVAVLLTRPTVISGTTKGAGGDCLPEAREGTVVPSI